MVLCAIVLDDRYTISPAMVCPFVVLPRALEHPVTPVARLHLDWSGSRAFASLAPDCFSFCPVTLPARLAAVPDRSLVCLALSTLCHRPVHLL
jgi:hypothetical protein